MLEFVIVIDGLASFGYSPSMTMTVLSDICYFFGYSLQIPLKIIGTYEIDTEVPCTAYVSLMSSVCACKQPLTLPEAAPCFLMSPLGASSMSEPASP